MIGWTSISRHGCRPSLAGLLLVLGACASTPPPQTAVVPQLDTVMIVDTVEVTRGTDPDPELAERIALLQLQVLERDAQIDELERKHDEAIREVVRAMARLQTLASRAEAASAMAEAEIALEALQSAAGTDRVTEAEQAARLLEMSTTEFNDQNYGGSLYLASEARAAARAGQARVGSGHQGDRRPGEVLFALPLPLKTLRRSNVRAGPGLGNSVLFTLEGDTPLTGHSFAEQWVRITDPDGRSGWIFHSLIGSRPRGDPQ